MYTTNSKPITKLKKANKSIKGHKKKLKNNPKADLVNTEPLLHRGNTGSGSCESLVTTTNQYMTFYGMFFSV